MQRQLFTKLFWIDAFERIVATFGESLLAFFVVNAAFTTIDWTMAFSVSGLAAVASLLKAVVAAAKADTDTASLVVDTKPLGEK